MTAAAVEPEPVPLARDAAGRLMVIVRHRDDGNAYLAGRGKKRGAQRAEIETRFPPEGLRARLLAHPDA